jgi:FSR family fosmidomycin resistance protein-like MFS transporter
VLIAITHGTIDAYASFLPPLLPRIMGKLGLSIALAATLATVLSIATSILQPAAGYLADRYGRRFLLAAGPVLTGVFMSLIGIAPSFTILLVFLVLGGLGSAGFHPPGVSLATRAEEGRGSGVRLSVFSFGGAAGFALGPLVAVLLVGWAGLEGLWIAMIPGVVLGVVLWLALDGQPRRKMTRPPPSPRDVLSLLRGPLGLVLVISAVGAFAQRTVLTFVPIIAARAGASETVGAVVLSVYLASQALGTLTSGFLTDRLDRRLILVVATALAVPAHVVAIVAPPAHAVAFTATVAAGFLNMALLPPIVVMAQEMVPHGTGASAGIVMGLAWALGSLAIPLTGLLADAFGPVPVAAWSMPALLIGTAAALHPALRPFRTARDA